MSKDMLKTVSVWCAAITCLALIACRGRTDVTGTPETPADWQNMVPLSVAPEEIAALDRARQNLCRLFAAGDREGMLALFAPDFAKVWGSSYDGWAGRFELRSGGPPEMASPFYERVMLRLVPAAAPSDSAKPDDAGLPLALYVDKSETARLFRLTAPDGLPIDPVERPFYPWWESGGVETAKGQRQLAITLNLFDRQWAGWSADQDTLWQNIQAWWMTQKNKYGTYDISSNRWRLAKFVGMAGDDAVVERDICFADSQTAETRCTFRFLMARDDSAPSAADPYKWRIKDISLYKTEVLPSEAAPGSPGGSAKPAKPTAPPRPAGVAPTAAGESAAAGGSGCGCGNTGRGTPEGIGTSAPATTTPAPSN
jgi:hypothetical protein